MTEQNPYAPPTADTLAAAPTPDSLNGATTGQRFLHFLLDQIGFFILVIVFFMAFGIGASFVAPQIVEDMGSDSTSPAVAILFYALYIGLFLLYYAGCETAFQRTPMKFLTGTKVVAENGGRPSFRQILGRNLARLVPFEPFSFLGGQRPVGWHDKWSGTRVVRTRGQGAYEG